MIKLNKSQNAICSVLLSKGPSTRREICAFSDLSWASISQAASQLIDAGILSEERDDEAPKKKGRPSGHVVFSQDLACLGLSINRDGIDAELWYLASDERQKVERRLDVEEDPVPTALESASSLLDANPDARIICVGVAFPGEIDSSRSEVISSVHFPEFSNRPVTMEIREALGIDAPVFVERNAVCDMADLVTRDGAEDVLLISLHSGVSAAVLIDGQILYGKSGNIGELGHLKHPDSTIPCACGRVGCMETLVGWLAWKNRFKRIARETGKPRMLFDEAIVAGDSDALELLRESANALFPSLENLCILLKPGKVAFSTNLPPSARKAFATVVERRLGGVVPESDVPKVEMLPDSSTVDGAAAIGAFWLSGHPQYAE